MAITSTRRVAKNTIVLYLRTLLIMLVSIYTGRVVLDKLGVSDYGVYNVVGGVVGLIGFVNGALGTATRRYLNVAMGHNDAHEMQRAFSMSIYCYALVAIISLLLAETFGLWFVCNKLNIPDGRMGAAVFMYQCTVIMFIIGILTVPYHSDLIAHERMDMYAYFSIIDVVLKLVVVYLLAIIDYDKLKVYGVLITLSSVFSTSLFVTYCRLKFSECRLIRTWDKEMFRGIFSFSGWMIIGTTSNVLSSQGINMLINIFFSPIYNAARGVAMTVYGAVNTLAGNFLVAVQPQIVQSYAAEDVNRSLKLVFSSSKLSAFLTFLLAIPIMIDADYILDLWLVEVPPFSALFVALIIFDSVITMSYGPIFNIAQAANKIRNYELTVSIGFVLIFGITWFLFKLNFPVYWAFITPIIINTVGLIARLAVLRHDVKFPARNYLLHVTLPILIVGIIAWLASFACTKVFPATSIPNLIAHIFISVLITFTIIWFIGCNSEEKYVIASSIKNLYKKFRK